MTKFAPKFMVRKALDEEQCSVCKNHDYYIVIPRNYGTHGGFIYCADCFEKLPIEVKRS